AAAEPPQALEKISANGRKSLVRPRNRASTRHVPDRILGEALAGGGGIAGIERIIGAAHNFHVGGGDRHGVPPFFVAYPRWGLGPVPTLQAASDGQEFFAAGLA